MSTETSAGDSPKKTVRRRRRRDDGRAFRAGVSDPPTRDSFSRTLALVRAALKAWEARHLDSETTRVWGARK